jgi:CarD family transcriptional regulator
MAKAASVSARRKTSAGKSTTKSAQKSAGKSSRVGSSKSQAAARKNIERKATTVEMRKKKTASAQKVEAARAKTKAQTSDRKAMAKAASRRAVTRPAAPKPASAKSASGKSVAAKPAAAVTVTKATKIESTVKAVKAVEPVVEKVKDVAAKAKRVAKTAVTAVADAPPPTRPVTAIVPKAASPKSPAKPEASASTILLETIRRVGQAAAEAKARVVAPAKAAVASVVSAPAPQRPEPVKTAPVAPTPVSAAPGAAPATAAPVQPQAAAPAPSPMRPGFHSDARLHHLQPRPAAKPAGAPPSFKVEEFIVYPAHGVGQIVAIEEQEVAGFKLELYVISFAKDKMTLKVPTPKVVSVGMRKLAEPTLVQKALDVLTGRARIKRTMWSRRAQEYEAKINSGDLVAIAEVIRDLYRSEAQPEQSYSERQLYEAALDRMAREIGAVEKLTETETLKLIETQLQKGPRRGVKPEGEGEGEAESESEVEEAAA